MLTQGRVEAGPAASRHGCQPSCCAVPQPGRSVTDQLEQWPADPLEQMGPAAARRGSSRCFHILK